MKKAAIVKDILKKILIEINSKEFIDENRFEENSFTRNRKLPFRSIILYIYNNTKKGLSIELDSFFEQIKGNTKATITKQAISKARQKISYLALEKLFTISNQIVFEKAKIKTFHGYQLLAVDGTTIQVPNNNENRNVFGVSITRNKTGIALSRTSILYDVLNDIIIKGFMGNYRDNERNHFLDFLESFTPHKKHPPLFLLDRGYPSKRIIYNFEKKKYKFLMRVSSSFIREVNESTGSDTIINYVYKKEKIRLRVIKVPLTSGETEILVTNLFEDHFFIEDFRKLYNLRWGIETKYLEIKHKYVVEKFTGTKTNCIKQDFYATLLLSNITSIMKNISDDEINRENKAKKLLHTYQTNRNALIGLFKKRFLSMMLHPKTIPRKLRLIIAKAMKIRSIIRPNRTRERICLHPTLNHQLNNKPVF